ncbi:MAG: DUF4013 domain-containing protein [Bacillota bacterium]
MVNIERALRLPLVDGGFVKVIIGAVLNMIPIVNFLSMGYLLQLAHDAVNEKGEMPTWENWGEKFVNGFLVFIACFVYMLIPIIVMMATGGLGSFQDGYSGLFAGGMALATLVALIIGFFVPMALTHYAATGSFAAAFSFGTIFSYIGKVFGSYILAYILVIALGIVLMFLSVIPLLGVIISILGGFYISCVSCILFADVYRQATQAKLQQPVS